MAKSLYQRVLLTGATGTLGRAITESKMSVDFITPPRKNLDIAQKDSVTEFFQKEKFDAVIHCAAAARMTECEKTPLVALQANILGTANLVEQVLISKKNIRFIHISTDGVYTSEKGNYSESDGVQPYNRYGWSKLGAESSVNLLNNFCIIRTRFFDPNNIRFDDSADDAFTSTMPVNDLVAAIFKLLQSDYVGTINVGGQKGSDYEKYKPYKASLKSCRLDDIQKKINFKISRDASMNIDLWNSQK